MDKITLRDKEGFALAVLCISDIWKPDLLVESKLVYGTIDESHPGVNYLMNNSGAYYIGGKLIQLFCLAIMTFKSRHSPTQLKLEFKKKWDKVVLLFKLETHCNKAIC